MSLRTLSLSFHATLSRTRICHSRDLSVIQSDCGNPGSISSSNVREKNNINSCLKILGITENENNKEKERKHWIPNQVGDDDCMVFGDDDCMVFGDDDCMVFGDDSYYGSSIKYFEDDNRCTFKNDISVVITPTPLSFRAIAGIQEVFLF